MSTDPKPDFWITLNGGMWRVEDRTGRHAPRAFVSYWHAETYVLGTLTWESGHYLVGANMIALTTYQAQHPGGK